MYAERIKSSGRDIDEGTRMMLEVYIPTFSVLSLLGVTAWITSGAVEVIYSKGHAAGGGNVDVLFLYGFSGGENFPHNRFFVELKLFVIFSQLHH